MSSTKVNGGTVTKNVYQPDRQLITEILVNATIHVYQLLTTSFNNAISSVCYDRITDLLYCRIHKNSLLNVLIYHNIFIYLDILKPTKMNIIEMKKGDQVERYSSLTRLCKAHSELSYSYLAKLKFPFESKGWTFTKHTINK